MEKIYIIFEASPGIKEEDVKDFEALNHRFCELVTLEEVTKGLKSLVDCKGILDCTMNFKIYNRILDRKEGIELKNSNGKTYIRTAKNNFLVKGIFMNQLMVAQYNEALRDEQNRNLEEYYSRIKTLLMLIPKISNRLRFEEGFKSEQGIDVSEMVGGKKTYRLVKEIPEIKDINVEYITPDDIKILLDLLKVGEYLS